MKILSAIQVQKLVFNPDSEEDLARFKKLHGKDKKMLPRLGSLGALELRAPKQTAPVPDEKEKPKAPRRTSKTGKK